MTITVARTCTEIRPVGVGKVGSTDSKPLSEYRTRSAYVLLGDPGSGKTTEFEQECEALGDAAEYVRARTFVRLDLDSHPKWRDKILFIDGLDEMRAGSTDARIPLDAIRNRLELLGKPRFRISCREADWLGPNDRRSLAEVYPGPAITVLLLDELNEQAIRDLLAEQVGIGNVESFRENTERHGLGAMLRNPHTLKLLAKAAGLGTAWPESRLETFELACRRMSAEYNEEHQVATTGYSTEVVLDAAGHLCALLLLCGLEGYTLAPGGGAGRTDSDGLAPLDDIEPGTAKLSRQDLKAALSTNLFMSRGDRGFVPCHRQVAEFLAGRYLASLVGKNLSARRVVELMTGSTDARVVTVLRGLSAWLAAHPGEARRPLIKADPVGVGLYGDIGSFSLNDKDRLLHSLVEFAAEGPLLGHQRQDGRADDYRDDTGWAFRSLASADMVPSIRNLLGSHADKAHRDRTAEFILDVLANAEDSAKQSLTALGPDLLAVVRDADRPSWVRKRSLDAYIHIVPSSDESDRALVELLDAIHIGSIPDPDDRLCETLLKHLYPEVIGPAGVWRFALPRPRHAGVSRLAGFWGRTIVTKSSDRHVAELLDTLSKDAARLIPALTKSYLDDLPLQLLARGLEAFGDDLETERLFRWLDVAFRRQDRLHLIHEEEDHYVREWLESRPHVQKAVYLFWLRRQSSHEQVGLHRPWGCDALNRSTLPGDFGLWCLDQAVSLEDREPILARMLLNQAYDALADPSIGEGLTVAVMHERIGVGALARHLDELCDRHSTTRAENDEWQRKLRERTEQRTREQRLLQEDWDKNLRAELGDLHNNRFFAPNLSTLAQVYLGIGARTDRAISPRQRIRNFIGGDDGLVDAVMTAIRDAIFRGDVPEVDETISLHAESRHSWLAYPVLASLHLLLESKDYARLDGISDDRKRRALAIHYCVPSDRGSQHWHQRWFRQEPELVLDVLYRCAASALRSGAEFVSCLNDLDGLGGHRDSVPSLAFNESTKMFEARSPAPRYSSHDELVHDTRLRLLNSIPVRGPKKQIGLLDDLLARAIQHPDKASLRELAARKSSLTSMAVAQRVRWLAVDALLSAAPTLQPVKEYVSSRNTEVRVRHFAEFLRRTSHRDNMHRSVLAGVRDPEVLRDAIEILGPSFGPVEWGGGYATLGTEMSDLMGSVIEQLGTLTGDGAARALEGLIEDPRLACWQDLLRRAHERQRIVHRDASYRHPGIAEVQRTLSGGAPANADELAALLQDRIADIASDVRGGDDNPWRSYWSDDRNRPPTKPKHEDSCRDALLRDLKRSLPVEVDAAPEGRYAADNRADIRVSCSAFNVPIEIKKNSHRDLWTAIRRQLIDLYTTDPATSGYGIYLVLWFGANETKTPPDGHRPDTPEELRRRLERQLTPDEARKISVIVMDVTKPGA